jgi:hypothetical protein
MATTVIATPARNAASITAHTTALTVPGLSPEAWALGLAYTFGIMGILGPYATGWVSACPGCAGWACSRPSLVRPPPK